VRALLVHNPNATSTNAAVTDVISKALSAELKLDVEATKRRGHASSLAAAAVDEGYEVVIALGGDGTVNEVVQGLGRTDVKLAIIPGGSTNVWARSLGLPADAVEATSVVLRKLRDREDRCVSLGRANGRWFTFAAGFGYDAAVVSRVEQRYRLKHTVRQATFVWCGLLALLSSQIRGADITVHVHGADGRGAALSGFRAAAACNSDPYTFLWRWPSRLCPSADLDGDLDLLALRTLALPRLLMLMRAALSGDRAPTLRTVQAWHGQPGYTLTSPVPLPVHVDGEVLEATKRLELRSVRRALTVVA